MPTIPIDELTFAELEWQIAVLAGEAEAFIYASLSCPIGMGDKVKNALVQLGEEARRRQAKLFRKQRKQFNSLGIKKNFADIKTRYDMMTEACFFSGKDRICLLKKLGIEAKPPYKDNSTFAVWIDKAVGA